MITLHGYQISDTMYKGEHSAIFKGLRISDKKPVIVKFLNSEYPSTTDIFLFRREFEIQAKLTGNAIARVYALEKVANSLAIIMEDINGESVGAIVHRDAFTIDQKLQLALLMTETLIQTHKQHIIHKDVNPSNFVWNRKTDTLKIIDFGIATELAREISPYINIDRLEGTLNYISPEQTGRMNRPVDYRTDLYSLGVTLYEIFTGRLPFTGEDEIELVYCHMAKMPIPPHEVIDQIPVKLSAIIMKLLSKTAEDRYQSTSGLLKDLFESKQELTHTGKIEKLVIGQHDVTDKFQIPNKLYGREAEVKVLMDAFGEAEKGHPALLLVTGAAGIGKSSLIQEIHKPVASRKGFYVSGKFEQHERNIPYSALIQAFKGLARQLLSETSIRQNVWKESLMSALGHNARVIIDLLPDLGRIIGNLPQVTPLNPIESQNRFLFVFREFIKTFAKKEHPLVVFLDDLQWADISTLELLKFLITSSELTHILCIGAYRDAEIKEGHPLRDIPNEVQKSMQETGLYYRSIHLKPLDQKTVNQLLSDTFGCEPEKSDPLSSLVFKKTDGNPFFTTQLLNSLYSKNTFTYEPTIAQWIWNLEKAEKEGMCDNVIDLLVQKLRLLSEQTLNVLKIAAGIGNTFTLKTLSLVYGQTINAVGSGLWEAIEKELILPLNNNYWLLNIQQSNFDFSEIELVFGFQHDRIQHAVYSLIPDVEKPLLHYKIGQELLRSSDQTIQKEILFELVNHLNIGKEVFQSTEQRTELADLNFQAGEKALMTTAFQTAAGYFETGKALLSKKEWNNNPRRYFEFSAAEAEAVFLSGNLDQANTLCTELFGIAKTKLEKCHVHDLQSRILEFQGNLPASIDEIRKSLFLLDVLLPEEPGEIEKKLGEGVVKMMQGLAQTPIEELVNLKEMTDEEKIMAMKLLYQVIPAAIQYAPTLFLLSALMMLDLTLSYGVTKYSCKCLVDCGNVQASILGDFETGYRLAETAFALLAKLRAESLKPAVYFVFTYMSHLRKHYKLSLTYFDMSYKTGLETGDILHASYARASKDHLLMSVGKNLTECKRDTESTITFLKESHAANPLFLAQIVLYSIEKLQAIPDTKMALEFERKDGELAGIIEKSRNMTLLWRFAQYNAFLHYILDEYEAAEKWDTLAENLIMSAAMDFPIPDHYLLHSLLLIKKWKTASEENRVKILETLNLNRDELKKWADNSPMNFLHKYYLLSAEMSVLAGESLETITNLYKKALESISTDDFTQMLALINESLGNFWLERNELTIGKAYIRESYYLYKRWDAFRKLAVMEKKYPHSFISIHETPAQNTGSSIRHSHGTVISNDSLDMTSIIKSTQAISGEIKIDRLLKTLMQVIIENAGAQQGCLLLIREGHDELNVEAKKESGSDTIEVMQSLPYTQSDTLCPEIISFVTCTRENLVLNDAMNEGNFQNNAYIREHRVKSVLCMPVVYQNSLKGVVYLENNLLSNVFTQERLDILKILASQASISIENARLYENMEEKVIERTQQLHTANEKLKELSHIDPLTHLNNRRYLHEYISVVSSNYLKKLSSALFHGEKRVISVTNTVMGIFLIDIDHFKDVNDTYGHTAGDNVLVSISQILKSIIRADDFLVRWGGEEFLIVLNNTNSDYLDRFSKKILQTIQNTPLKLLKDKTINKTCSLGFTQIPFNNNRPDFLTLEQAINLSDFGLYTAKETGRNRAVLIKIKEGAPCDEKMKKELINISKNSKINDEYIELITFR